MGDLYTIVSTGGILTIYLMGYFLYSRKWSLKQYMKYAGGFTLVFILILYCITH